MKTFYERITTAFLNEFDSYWIEMLETINCKQIQLIQGNRLRPQICLWGYLATLSFNEKQSLELIASVSVSIEMIHKASIMLDDWIDEDCERHGNPAFHTEYSPQNTVITALTIIGFSLKRLKQIIPNTSLNLPHYYFLCLDTLIDTIYSMADGALKELNLNVANIYNIESIQEITQLETSAIIGNSMLIGYYTGLAEKGPNSIIVDKFKLIGDMCGYIFQTMNDLEIFSNPQKLYAHKGNFNSDITKKRKNIAIATLYDVASSNDKKIIAHKQENLLYFMKKYNISEILKYQLLDIYNLLKKNVFELEEIGISKGWINNFLCFLDYIKNFGEDRLKQ